MESLTTNVPVAKFIVATGYTRKAIDCKIARGTWQEGFEYHRARDTGELTIYLPGYERWAQGKPRDKTGDLANGAKSK